MSREAVWYPARSRGRSAYAARFPVAQNYYRNTIVFVFYMVFTNRDFNDNKFLNIRFPVKSLNLLDRQK